MTEEKLDEITQQFGGARESFQGMLEDEDEDLEDEEGSGHYGRSSKPSPREELNVAWPRPALAAGHPQISRSRSPERLQARRVAPVARRLPAPDSPPLMKTTFRFLPAP